MGGGSRNGTPPGPTTVRSGRTFGRVTTPGSDPLLTSHNSRTHFTKRQGDFFSRTFFNLLQPSSSFFSLPFALPFAPFPSLPFASLPVASLRFASLPFALRFPSLPLPSLPFPSLPFPALPFPSLPYPPLPFPSLPFPSLPFRSLPFPFLPSPSSTFFNLLQPSIVEEAADSGHRQFASDRSQNLPTPNGEAGQLI